jgi:hypothetical protein
MSTIGRLIKILALANLLAVLGFVGWLVASGRVDGARIAKVRDIFKPTIAEESAARAEGEAQAAEAERLAAEQRKLLETPMARTEQIVSAERFEQRAALAVRGLKDEQSRLLEDLSSRERGVTEREEALAKRKVEWENSIAEEKERQTKEQFRKAVRLLESAPAKQGKEWILELVRSNREDQAVAYLDAMNPAKSAGLLKAFKGEGEAKVATDLLERLRQLGLESEINAGAANDADSAVPPADSARPSPRGEARNPNAPAANGPASLPRGPTGGLAGAGGR